MAENEPCLAARHEEKIEWKNERKNRTCITSTFQAVHLIGNFSLYCGLKYR